MRLLALATLASALAVGLAWGTAPQGRAAPTRTVASADVFQGLGTWIDVYDTSLYASPNAVAARLATGLGRFVDSLHTRGIRVVGWYLPGHDNHVRDLRRARALLGLRTPQGSGFDGIALDVESLRNPNVKQRTTRLLDLLAHVRAESSGRPVAAITYPPRALERHLTWWPGFPWAQIAAQVDAFAPMLYTGGGFKGYDATYGYVARSLRLLRAAVGSTVAVHAAGGVANRMTADELRAFDDAVLDDGTVTGWSLYDLQTTTPAGWAAMARLSASLG